jgi:hypothetical protein
MLQLCDQWWGRKKCASVIATIPDMPKRSSKPRDLNAMAASIVKQATDGEPQVKAQKDPAAVSLGRRGGLKGGKVRAERMTSEERSEAARRAARKRWDS